MKIVNNPHFQSIFNNMKLDIFFHGYVYADAEWNLDPYTEPCHRLYYVTDGEAIMYTDREEVVLEKGYIYVLPRRIPYGLRCDGTMEKFFVHFTMNIVPGLDAFDCFQHYLRMPLYHEGLDALPRLAQTGNVGDILKCKSLIYDTLSRFLEPHSQELMEQAKKMLRYQTLYEYIENHCTFGITVQRLAQVMGVSPSYLSRVFKKDIGITLKQYVNTQIMDRAKQALIFTEKPIKTIAMELQFCDEFYFSNYFKRHTRFSPKSYRKMNRLNG